MRFTIDHVHAMAEAGFFNPDDRVELIGGEIYVNPPPGQQHSTVSDRLDYHLRLAVIAGHWVKPEPTLELSAGDLVTADLCVLDVPPTEFVGYPPVDHIVLLIEIAKTSQHMDRGKKLAGYAESGVGEYWVIDIPEQTVEVYTMPTSRRYRRRELYGREDVIPVVPGTSGQIAVADLFPAGIDWD